MPHDFTIWLLVGIILLLVTMRLWEASMSKQHNDPRHFVGEHHHDHDCACCREIAAALSEIAGAILELVPSSAPEAPDAFVITQIFGATMPTNNSIVAGTTGTFQATPTLQGNPNPLLPGAPVPTWVADDPAVVLTPSADGLTVQAAVPASDTNPSFNLGISGADGANGATITGGPVNVTITPAGPPPPQAPDAFQIQQLS